GTPISHAILYKTGDLAAWRHDGNVLFIGRKDMQVKIRGIRIETGEVESQLLRCDEIKEAYVMSRKDRAAEKYLCAYLTTENRERIDINAIKEKLSQKLPAYMIPAHIVQVENIPVTESGKIDRKALPAPQTGPGERQQIKPRTQMEKNLTEIWAEVLKMEKEEIGIDESFFIIGGHSLNAVTMISKVHKKTDVKIPLPKVFKNNTIRLLSKYIKESEQKKYEALEPVEKKDYYYLSSAQKRLYILQQMEQESIAYNMPEQIHLREKPQKGKLERTFLNLIERHESLRTSFHMVKETPVQVIRQPGEIQFSIERYELRKGETLKQYPPFIRHFDLSKAPLLRVGILKTETPQHEQGERYTLMVDMHHIISDGVSHEILEREFIAIYK
ncbi:MAG: non-ribosomal peptide synthetase, partial [bacterium]|nr:non-ribosomal peptide synthetase [bacterium]